MLANNRKAINFDKTFLPWIICSIGMLFYCFNYFIRVSPSVMQNDLMQELHITADQFGDLLFFYYIPYTLMQIPVGMIYDRFGARIVLFIACLIATVGVGVFIAADNFVVASIGRFLIGFGTAFAYIGVLKLASLWLAPNRFATVAGLTTAFGMASAIFSDLYLTQLVQLFGYKNALHTAFLVGFALSLFILVFMRNKAVERPVSQLSSWSRLKTSLRITLMNPQMWLIGIIGCLFYLPASVFLDAWGIPYLKAVYQLTPEQAASVVIMTFVGWMIAGPTIGALSDKIKRRRSPLLISAVMAAILFDIVFYVPGISLMGLYVIFFLIGIFCGAHPLCFALGKENSPNAIAGTAVAVTNTLIMAGGVIFHPIVGKLLVWHASSASLLSSTPVYNAMDYTYALSVVPLGLVLAIFLTFFIKETYCESHDVTEERKRSAAMTAGTPPLRGLEPQAEAVPG
jgi:MFS family permease